MHWSMRALPSRSCLSRFRLMARPWLTPMLSLAHCRLTVLPAMTWLLPLAMPHPARLFAGAPTSGAVVPSVHFCRRPSTLCSRSLRRWSRWLPLRAMRFLPSRFVPSPDWSCATSTLFARPTRRSSSVGMPFSWAPCFPAASRAGISLSRPSPRFLPARRSRSSMPCSGPRPRAKTCSWPRTRALAMRSILARRGSAPFAPAWVMPWHTSPHTSSFPRVCALRRA